jgi:broad specificity phosphatase PhoE
VNERSLDSHRHFRRLTLVRHGETEGESNPAFRRRVARALHATLSAAPPGHLLFVVHKGIIRSCLSELLGRDGTRRHGVEVALGSIHVVRQERGRWRADCLDRTDHLL